MPPGLATFPVSLRSLCACSALCLSLALFRSRKEIHGNQATLDKSDGEIKALAFFRAAAAAAAPRGAPGCLMLASGSTDRKLQLWKLLPASEAAGRPAQTSARDGGEGAFGWVKTACMTGHSGTIVALAFAPAVAPDARGELPRVRLVSGSYDRSARCPNVLCACPHVLCASLLVCAEGGGA